MFAAFNGDSNVSILHLIISNTLIYLVVIPNNAIITNLDVFKNI